jgi:class 3 adenylate cyclase
VLLYVIADIVSFTTLASRISPEDVVAILNVMFSTFDQITVKHNVYKVETIGDAYLACTGVTADIANASHTHNLGTHSHFAHLTFLPTSFPMVG